MSSSFRRPYTEVGPLAYVLTEHLSTTGVTLLELRQNDAAAAIYNNLAVPSRIVLQEVTEITEMNQETSFPLFSQKVQPSEMCGNLRASTVTIAEI